MRKLLPVVIALALIYSLWQLPVWDQGVEKVAPDEAPSIVRPGSPSSGNLPPGHPPLDGGTAQNGGAPAMGSAPPMGSAPSGSTADPSSLPLAEAGLGGQHELDRALERIEDPAVRESFEDAFRLTFTTSRDARDYGRARGILEEVVEAEPDLAEAYRSLAYCEFNLTMSFPRTIELYEQAIDLDPDYGEAHYSLAFMLGSSDPERGATHFARAMELGVEDERNLRDRFYQGVQ